MTTHRGAPAHCGEASAQPATRVVSDAQHCRPSCGLADIANTIVQRHAATNARSSLPGSPWLVRHLLIQALVLSEGPAGEAGSVPFRGDPHGLLDHILEAAGDLRASAVILLGDMDSPAPLNQPLSPIANITWWIPPATAGMTRRCLIALARLTSTISA